jgi:hypothetical protein
MERCDFAITLGPSWLLRGLRAQAAVPSVRWNRSYMKRLGRWIDPSWAGSTDAPERDATAELFRAAEEPGPETRTRLDDCQPHGRPGLPEAAARGKLE